MSARRWSATASSCPRCRRPGAADAARVGAVQLRGDTVGAEGSGVSLPADLVVVGIGARPNTGLLEGQVTQAAGGLKVDHLCRR